MQINNQKMLKELPAQTFYINVILILFANTVYFFCIATYPCHCQEPSIKARYHQKSSLVLLPERQLTKSHSTIEWCHQNSCRMTNIRGHNLYSPHQGLQHYPPLKWCLKNTSVWHWPKRKFCPVSQLRKCKTLSYCSWVVYFISVQYKENSIIFLGTFFSLKIR